jgi:hypothetical protein
MRTKIAVAALLSLFVFTAFAAPGPQGPTTEQRAEADRAWREQDWKAAREGYAAITAREPKNGQALQRLALAHQKLGEYPQAIAAYRRVIEIGSNPTAMYNLACAHALAGELDPAFEWLDKALVAGFPQPALIASDPDLAALRKDPRFASLAQHAEELAHPCLHDPRAREFDFWIGEWNVVDPAGNQVGSSRIERLLDGCAILENWTSGTGHGGKSLNLFHQQKGCWQQTWVDDQGGVVEFTDGRFADGAMRFRAKTARPDGTEVERKLSFFDLGKDKVRQLSEQSTDGKSWAVEYDFTYLRKK